MSFIVSQKVFVNGRTVGFRLRLAQSLWETEQFHQTMNEWRAVTAQEPGNIEARLGLARAHLKAGERVEAFREFQRVLLIAPDHPEARHGLARLGGGTGGQEAR